MSTPQKNKPLIVAVSLLAIIAAGVLLVSRRSPGTGAVQGELVAAMSQQLAAEIATLTDGPARIVCVSRAGAPATFASEKAVGTFRAAAGKQGHTLVAEEYIPLEEMHSTDQGIRLKASSLLRVMQEHGDADVVVSFVGVPHFEAGEAEQLSGQSARLVAVAYGEPALDQLLAQGVIDLAVVFDENTPLDNPKVSRAELEQFISFRRGGP